MSNKKDFIIEIKAEELGLSLKEYLGENLEHEFLGAIESVANAAYASIVAKAQQDLNSTRKSYLENLTFDKIGENQYLISLDGAWPNKVEDGFGAYDMKPVLLGSDKIVDVGSRAGLPWVQTGKKGQKYGHVPFSHRPFAKAPAEAARLGKIIQGLTAKNKQGLDQKITQVFKDGAGNPLEGKVATVGFSGVKDLDNLVKYQKIQKNPKTGKETVQSIFHTYRTVSENSPSGKWEHSGYSGLHAFQEAEEFIEKELDEILRIFLG